MRILSLAIALLVSTSMSGCFDGNFGVCIGQETPLKIIRDDQCSEWVIEIDYVTDQAPRSSALTLLDTRMDSLVNKDKITITTDQTNLEGRSEWTFEQLRSLESQTRGQFTGGSTIATHVLYVDGELKGKPDVLAFAQGSRYVVVFQDRIERATSSILVSTTAEEMERAVLVHEFGHILGLVNNGIPMQSDREDDDHSGHSTNENSVMFWAVESTSALDFFGDTEPPTQFDANDRADICAAGGKC